MVRAPHAARRLTRLLTRRARACAFAAVASSVSALSVAAARVAPRPSLATLPVALTLFATAAANLPVAAAVRLLGRRTAYVACAAVGAGGGAIAAASVARGSFGGLCAAAVALGAANASAQQYRFTAAELVPAHARPAAISAVLSGGVLGAVAGPEYAKRARLLLPRHPFAGVFCVTAGVCALNAALVAAVRFPPPPPPPAASAQLPAPPLRALLAAPARAAAIAVAAICWFQMVFLMVPVPLAMLAAGFSFDDASLVVQLHMLAMYLPSFGTGRLVARVGPFRAMVAGTAVAGAACVIFRAGAQLPHYLLGELAVGAGWNLQFVGATAQLAAAAAAGDVGSRGGAVAAVNDVIVFAAAGAGSVAAAPALRALGWRTGHQAVAGGAAGAVLAVLAAQAAAERRQARRRAAAAVVDCAAAA